MANPFTPAFGTIPLYPAGRDRILSDFSYAFQNYHGNPLLNGLLVGPRGSGKTSLLNMIADESKKHGWLAVSTVAQPGMLEDIYQQLLIQAAELTDKKARKVSSVQIGKIGISFQNDQEVSFNWRNRMDLILKQLSEYGTGLLILIDETIADEPEMIELTSAYQLLKGKYEKTALMMAGLPSNISALLNEKSVTFLRRAHRIYLGKIADHDIEIAFRKSVESEGKRIETDALALAVNAIDGYAYMMQLVGYYTWKTADGNIIDCEDAKNGIKYAKADFREGVLESTYRELSANDRKFLFAMLEDPKESTLKNIAARMNKTAGYASTYKSRLLMNGVIEENPGKTFSIILPSFREYLMEMKQNG